MPIVCENSFNMRREICCTRIVCGCLGNKLRWCLRTEDPEYFHKIPSIKEAGERRDYDLGIYLHTFA
jgi:hypothetical protein